MPPVKDDKAPNRSLNTSAQIQQIFSEIQSQLPSVNFDNDDRNENDDDNDEILEPTSPENTDALLESLSINHNNSLLTLHPRTETPPQQHQQPPSVEAQMRVSPNLFENPFQYADSPPKPSILSMDLFNSIDFDKLPTVLSHPEPSQRATLTRTFNRPRPMPKPSSQQQEVNVKTREDRLILERLTQQANKYHPPEKSPVKREQHPLQNLQSALYATSSLHADRHGRRLGAPESERKTIYIDLRNSNAQKPSDEPQSNKPIALTRQHIPSSDSDSDDEGNDGMLWFEKRQQIRKQQQQSNSSK